MPPSSVKKLLFALAVLALLACSLQQLRIQARVFHFPGTDMTAPAAGTRAAFRRSDPYSGQMTQQIQRLYYGHVLQPDENWDRQAFAYPLHAVFFFAPLAWLSPHALRMVTLLLWPLLMAASGWLWARILLVRPPRWLALATALGFLLSWPAVAGIAAEQPTVPVFFALSLACYLVQRRLDFLAGVLLACATVKPQLCVLLVAWLCVYAMVHRRFRLLAAFFLTLAALLIAAQGLVPGWLSGWRHAVAAYGSGLHRPLLIQFLGPRIGVACMVLLALWTLRALWQIGMESAAVMPQAFALLLAATLAVTPANPWLVYNCVLLLPAVLLLVSRADGARVSRLVALAAASWLWLIAPAGTLAFAALGYRYFQVTLPLWSAPLPLLLTIALCLRASADPAAA